MLQKVKTYNINNTSKEIWEKRKLLTTSRSQRKIDVEKLLVKIFVGREKKKNNLPWFAWAN